MPYCVQCGKMVSEEIILKNNGECKECGEKGKQFDIQVKLSTAQIAVEKLTKCTHCQTMTSVRCQMCKKPLCQAHLKMYKAKHSPPMLLCEECYAKESRSSTIFSLCICMIGLLIMIFPLFFSLSR